MKADWQARKRERERTSGIGTALMSGRLVLEASESPEFFIVTQRKTQKEIAKEREREREREREID